MNREKARNVALALLGSLGLLVKHRLAGVGGTLVHDYAGNVAGSFAAFFVLRIAPLPGRFGIVLAAVLALAAAELFEATNGFGFMSNTYDPGDYVANVVGVGLALGVEGVFALVSRLRRRSEPPST